ncbi:NADH-quinone oxidoreductase subunit L [bacterium]|nr:NADH-quinone oxidoreductase subunit L [bacterium]
MVRPEHLAPLIPLFPFLAYAITIFGGRKLPGKGAYIPIAFLSLSTLLSFYLFIKLFPLFPNYSFEANVPWLMSNGWIVSVGYRLDALSLSMSCMVALVALLIHIYSIGYMEGDKRYSLYFAYLSLFTSAMLTLVISNSLLLLYIGWELVGLCSYLLIGFWYERPPAYRAAMKAFLTTRMGDIGFFIGLLYIFLNLHSTAYGDLEKAIPQLGEHFALIASTLLFIGAIGKSAQFPLHIWLPDAMEGPTPVSALIHAATMVAAGAYMVARLFPLFSYSTTSLLIVAIIGAITAILAAFLALVQNDIKRVLAYSTMSQLGYMMLGLGMGNMPAGMFHLLSHGFFKALLFMSAGCIIHHLETNDIWEMGGLWRRMPIASLTFLVGTLSLAGLPPFGGYFSKEMVIASTYGKDFIFFALALFGAFLTALYMGRVFIVAFIRPSQGEKLHESNVMSLPIIILAFITLIFGFGGKPFVHILGGGEEHGLPFPYLPLLFPLGGFLSAYLIYIPSWDRERAMVLLKPIHTALLRRLYIDDFYIAVLVKPAFIVSRLLADFDFKVIDGIVNGVGRVTVITSYLQSWIDNYVVDGFVNATAWITGAFSYILRYLQSGYVQFYLLMALLGLLIFLLV